MERRNLKRLGGRALQILKKEFQNRGEFSDNLGRESDKGRDDD